MLPTSKKQIMIEHLHALPFLKKLELLDRVSLKLDANAHIDEIEAGKFALTTSVRTSVNDGYIDETTINAVLDGAIGKYTYGKNALDSAILLLEA